MVKEKTIQSFFKRKKDEVMNENNNSVIDPIKDSPPHVPVVQLEGQSQGIEPQPIVF